MPAMAKPASRPRKPASAQKPKPKPKPPSAKPKPSSAAASHPPYFQMIKDAIVALKEKTGSSSHAIAKHMEEKHGAALPANYKKMLATQLRGFAAKGKLVKVKASFKLSDAGKKDAAPKPKPAAKPAAKPAKEPAKPKKAAAGTKRKAPEKKKVVKKAKKSPAAKVKAKPKTIRSPAAKKTRKVAAA